MEMEKRIELEKRGRPTDKITDLNLDNCRSTQITGLTDEFKNLKSLSLINVGLTTLKGFPDLPNLGKLELGDNRLSGGLNFLHGCPMLSYLNLGGNKFKDIESLQPLKDLKGLRTLDLFNCEVTNLENYRESIFELLTDLKYLDGFDRNDQEADEEDEGDDDGSEVSGENGDEVVDVDEDDEDDEEEEDGEEVGLNYLTKPLEDESDGEEFEPGEDADEDDDDDDDDLDIDENKKDNKAAEPERGVKRKKKDDDTDEDEKDD